jgi:hypothetical protein
MEVVRASELNFKPPPLTHRGPGIEFKDLFRGTEGTPENYYFALAKQEKFYSPVHKHNFDQFRYAYRGDFSIASDVTIRQGELAYHPEGVEYGPQNDGNETEHILMIIQFGGASGQGFLTYDQLATGQAKLKETGRFEKGKYYRNGSAEPQDGFDALYQLYTGRKLEYPPGRYNTPILMKPQHFAWKPVPHESEGFKAYKKLLGVFSERGTLAEMIKIEEGGVLRVAPEDAIQLFFVVNGKGDADGRSWETESAMRLQPGKRALLEAAATSEIIHFVFPMLSTAT